MSKISTSLIYTVLFFCTGSYSYAASSIKTGIDNEWSFAVNFGVFAPKLDALDNGIFKAPITGVGKTPAEVGEGGDAVAVPFSFDQPLPTTKLGGKAAFELFWHPNKKHNLIFGIGSWEKSATVSESGKMYIGQEEKDVDFSRFASFSYSEYYVGWRYQAYENRKFSISTIASLHELFDINFEEKLVFLVKAPNPNDEYKRITIDTAQAAANLLGRVGASVNWNFTSWFNMAIEGSYYFAPKLLELIYQNTKKNDFKDDQTVSLTPRFSSAEKDGKLAYATTVDENTTEFNKAPLDFSGWQLMLRMNFFY